MRCAKENIDDDKFIVTLHSSSCIRPVYVVYVYSP